MRLIRKVVFKEKCEPGYLGMNCGGSAIHSLAARHRNKAQKAVGEVFIERQDFGLKAVLCLPARPRSPPVGNLSVSAED